MTRTAAQFNTWICANAAKLKERLSLYNTFDEDAFQDAYLSLVSDYEKEESSPLFEKAFIAAYRKHSGKNLNESYTTCHSDDLFFTLLAADDETEDENPKPRTSKWLIGQMRIFIRKTFPTKDVAAFEMRLTGSSYRDISDCLGIGTAAIKTATERIALQTRLSFATALNTTL